MDPKDRPIKDLNAGDAFRQSLIPRADGHSSRAPMWFGWALMDAFLAGVDHGRTHPPFTMEDANLMRQWFNAVEDLAPKYLEKADRDLMQKIAKAWFKVGTSPRSSGRGQPPKAAR